MLLVLCITFALVWVIYCTCFWLGFIESGEKTKTHISLLSELLYIVWINVTSTQASESYFSLRRRSRSTITYETLTDAENVEAESVVYRLVDQLVGHTVEANVA